MRVSWRRLVPPIVVAAVTVSGVPLTVAAAPAAAGDWMIRTRTIPDSDLCSYPGRERILRALGPASTRIAARPNRDVTFRGFKRKIGKPARVHRRYKTRIEADWVGRKAARFTFVTYGMYEGPGALLLQYGVLTGRKWVTEKGIRVGSTLTQIKQQYGDQAWRIDSDDTLLKGVWWSLAGGCSPFGDEGQAPVLAARIRDGRVSALRVAVGAAGE